MDERLMTIPQVCAYLHMSRSGVYGMIRGGTLPGVLHIGGCVRVDKQALDAWIEEKRAA